MTEQRKTKAAVAGGAPLAGHGGPGRGGGRKLESGASAVRKTVTLDPADIPVFIEAGDGELSKGIRVAAQLLRESKEKTKKALRSS